MLFEDLTERYLREYRGLPTVCKRAWDESVTRRLHAMLSGGHARDAIYHFLSSWQCHASTLPLRIHFGQMRAGTSFQGNATGGQDEIAGFPTEAVLGRPIEVVRGDVANGSIRPDQLPIQIFWSHDHQRWVAINNRGYATYCLARVQPLRLWPRAAEQAEINRLRDAEDFDLASYAPGFLGTREDGVRSLPSDWLPLTRLQQLPFQIEQIARVPPEWQ
jgi:hypothetical protein